MEALLLGFSASLAVESEVEGSVVDIEVDDCRDVVVEPYLPVLVVAAAAGGEGHFVVVVLASVVVFVFIVFRALKTVFFAF